MGEVFGQLLRALGTLGTRPVGPPFALFHTDGEAHNIEFSAGIPVPDREQAVEGVFCDELPGGYVAFVLHSGPYAGIGRAYQAIEAWARDKDRECLGPPREVYLVGPGQSEDAADYRTEVVWPIS